MRVLSLFAGVGGMDAAYGADDYPYLFDKEGYMVIPNKPSTKKEAA